MTIEELRQIIKEAMDQDILAVEIVDEHPFDENGEPRTHFAGHTKINHFSVVEGVERLYIGAIFGAWNIDKPAPSPESRSSRSGAPRSVEDFFDAR